MSEFDNKAKEWDLNRMHHERTVAVAQGIRERIPLSTAMTALEFGAGTGLLSFELKEQLGVITLMDTSPEMLRIAESKVEPGEGHRIRTRLFDLEQHHFRESSFDIIYSQMVLHHVGDVALVLMRFFDMLKPGGSLALADLYSEDGTFHDPGVKVHPGFDPDALAEQLEAAGFSGIRHERCFVIRRPQAGGIMKEFPVFLLTAGKSL